MHDYFSPILSTGAMYFEIVLAIFFNCNIYLLNKKL